MGQKTNPIGLRVAVNKDWGSKWFAEKKEFGKLLTEDREIRELLKKKLDLQVTALGNAAMKMPMMGMHMAMPNIVNMLPGVDAGATVMMKNLIKKKGVASIEELREAAIESDVKIIACQMTLDLFEYNKSDLIDGVELGGAATYMERARKSDINLFI